MLPCRLHDAERYDFLTTASRYSRCINNIATHAGAADKFNTAITIVFLSIIAERIRLDEYSNAKNFLWENNGLLENNPMKRLYSAARLQSKDARLTLLLPDRVA